MNASKILPLWLTILSLIASTTFGEDKKKPDTQKQKAKKSNPALLTLERIYPAFPK